jgi:MFS superfamily sulfate permease-like transporter
LPVIYRHNALLISVVSLQDHLPDDGINLKETDTFEDVRLYDAATEIPNLKICQLESFLFYGNVEFVKDSLMAEVGVRPFAGKIENTDLR